MCENNLRIFVILSLFYLYISEINTVGCVLTELSHYMFYINMLKLKMTVVLNEDLF
jgi:hypothetical protein